MQDIINQTQMLLYFFTFSCDIASLSPESLCSQHIWGKRQFFQYQSLWMIIWVPDTTEWLGLLLPIQPGFSHPHPPPEGSGQRNRAAYVCKRGDSRKTGTIFSPFLNSLDFKLQLGKSRSAQSPQTNEFSRLSYFLSDSLLQLLVWCL